MTSVFAPQDQRAFQVDCSAIPVGSFRAGVDLLSVAIGQRICKSNGVSNVEEMWDSVVVRCKEENNELSVQVLVFHPGWDRPLQIACIRSRRGIESESQDVEPVRLSLEHIQA